MEEDIIEKGGGEREKKKQEGRKELGITGMGGSIAKEWKIKVLLNVSNSGLKVVALLP